LAAEYDGVVLTIMAARRTYTCRASSTRIARDWVCSSAHLFSSFSQSHLICKKRRPASQFFPSLPSPAHVQTTALREQRTSSKGRRYRNRQLIELLVSKESGSLGITIGGGVDSGHTDKTQVFITQIKPDGAAERQVRLMGAQGGGGTVLVVMSEAQPSANSSLAASTTGRHLLPSRRCCRRAI
jgi:hypothetical protein